MRQPLKVSVVITCYNYAEYVGEAIESVLAQTYKNIDLIIIDDGSTDNSLEVIKNYEHNKNVKIVSRDNKGIVYTRNEALGMAKGEFMCFLDADDYFNHDYIENMVTVAQKHDADVAYPNWRIFGDSEYTRTFPEFDIQKLIRQDIHCTSESLVRLSSIGNHKFESEEVAEDWDFFLGMALDGRRFKLAKDCYINYRVRKDTRGTTRPYWDDMYHFYNILKKWSKKYPDIVNPVDLPIYVGRQRDDYMQSQDRHVIAQEKIIEEKDLYIKEKDMRIKKLNDELHALKSSYSYRTGRFILSPLRSFRYIKRKLLRVAKKYLRKTRG